VSEAVRESAVKIVAAAHLTVASLRFESVFGRGLRVIAGKSSNVQILCGVILVYKTPDGIWDLAENEPPRPEMSERERRWRG